MATARRQCEKCNHIGYFQVLHGDDECCPECGDISKNHSYTLEPKPETHTHQTDRGMEAMPAAGDKKFMEHWETYHEDIAPPKKVGHNWYFVNEAAEHAFFTAYYAFQSGFRAACHG